MNIGEPKTTREIEPVTTPVPEDVPVPVERPAEVEPVEAPTR
jgi:hypothetical protein